MDPELAKALGEIERGAERRLRARRQQLDQIRQGIGSKQAAVARAEETEEPEVQEVNPEVQSEDVKDTGAKTVTEQDERTAMEEDTPGVPQPRRKTQLVAALKKARTETKRKEQGRDEATKWRRATDVALGDVDLEVEMEKVEEAETAVTVAEGVKTAKTTTTGSAKMIVTTTMASSSTQVVTAEVYARQYTKTAESRGERSMARSEKKEARERETVTQKQKDDEDLIAREREAEEQHKVIEKALLEEEERTQAELLHKMREKTEKKKQGDTAEAEPEKPGKETKKSVEREASKDEPEKQEEKEGKVPKDKPKKHDKQVRTSSTHKASKGDDENVSKGESKKQDKEAKKSAERGAKKRKHIAEEEEQYADDEELDPDFDPDKEFIEEDDMVIEEDDEEDMFETHKHSHAMNFKEAGEFVVWVRATLNELQRAVKRGKEMAKHYRQFVAVLKDAIIQMGSWGPMEGGDVDEVVKAVVDTNCTAWKKAMLGVKTGDSKTIMEIEEKREGVIRVIEDKDIPAEDDTTVIDPEKLKGKTEEEKKEVKMMLRKFWSHIEKAHTEAACAAGELGRLATVLEPDEYFKLVEAGTRPIITIEMPKAKQMIEKQKEIEGRARSREDMKNMKIEDIVIEQNLPTPLDKWKDSKVLLPTRYLAAAVHYFVYSQVDQANPMTNKLVAAKFKLSPSNLHRIITGRRYSGGSTKVTPEEHGERFVKVAKTTEMAKGKGRGKSSVAASESKGSDKKAGTKVTVAKVTPKLIDLPFLEDTPAEGTRGAKKRKKDDDPKGKK